MPAWVVFGLSGLVVVLAGVRLSRDGDVIAEQTGLGGVWIGAILVAASTSLPELLTDFFAVRQGEVNLAIGDLVGSSMANMLILAIADLALRRQRVLTRVAINQALVGVLGISLTSIVVAGMLTDGELSLLGIGWSTPVVVGSYLAGARILYANRQEPLFQTAAEAEAEEEAMKAFGPSLRRASLGFAASALAILAAAPFLASSAADVADQIGVSSGVVGVALLAVTTSLPELSVTIGSIRAGSYDLAVGNLLGSNCVNMTYFLLFDLVDGGGPLLANAETSALVSGMFVILLMGQTVIEVLNKAEERIWWLEPDAVLRIMVYAFGIYLVVQAGN